MKKILFLMLVLIGGGYAMRQLVDEEKGGGLAQHCVNMMGRMMEGMPDDAPPKFMMTSLRRIEEQNEEILALLRQGPPAEGSSPPESPFSSEES
jgi:hypothetical protein